MKLRIICQEMDCTASVHALKAVAEFTLKTFEVDAPPGFVDWWVIPANAHYVTHSILGIEVIDLLPEVQG